MTPDLFYLLDIKRMLKARDWRISVEAEKAPLVKYKFEASADQI